MSAFSRAIRRRLFRQSPCIRRRAGSQIPTWTARPKSCRGMHRKPAACIVADGSNRRRSSRTWARRFEQRFGKPLSGQEIVLTVPASFDEEARQLTVVGGQRGGH